jgi:hypothetical protein
MAHIKLTEAHYVDPEAVAQAYLDKLYDGPFMEVFFKAEHLGSTYFRGDEAVEAWANWKAYADNQKQ